MPKGRAGISGYGWSPMPPTFSEEQKREILDMLFIERDLPETVTTELREEAWMAIFDLIANYRGQAAEGQPPTETAIKHQIEKLQNTASQLLTLKHKLDRDLASAEHRVAKDRLHKAIRRQGGEGLYKDVIRPLEEGFDRIEQSLYILTKANPEDVKIPKGYPDRYLVDLLKALRDVWKNYTGKAPKRRVFSHETADRAAGEEGGPFYDWVWKIQKLCRVDNYAPAFSYFILRQVLKNEK